MAGAITIGLVGDYHPDVTAHRAIPLALDLAARSVGRPVEAKWLPTATLEGRASEAASGCDGIWCVPASPYESMAGALDAIRFARESDVPFLGTCGGFQHAVIEYARNVLGLAEADHAETSPDAVLPLVAPLSCALVEADGGVTLSPGSRVCEIYGRIDAQETYHCSFGLNPHYRALLEGYDMRVTGVDSAGEVRVVEIDRHPFFFATLFQPERAALRGEAHPLVDAFVRAASASRGESA